MRTILLMLGLGMAAACSGDLTLEDRPCPCASGWSCCERTNRCVRSEQGCGGPELTVLMGIPGGKGTADGVARAARFSNPVSIVGNAQHLYVTDGPLWEGGYYAQAALGRCVQEECPTGSELCMQRCVDPAILGPYGVRRISRATGETTWLVRNRILRPLALGAAGLFAGTSEVTPMVTDYGLMMSIRPPRVIVRIDAETGSIVQLAGSEYYSDLPRDGAGWGARFGGIAGMVADGAGMLYVVDRHESEYALRRVEIETGAVTTLVAKIGWPGDSGLDERRPVAFHGGGVYVVTSSTQKKQQTIWRYGVESGALDFESPPLPDYTEIRSLCANDGQVMAVFGHCVGRMAGGYNAEARCSYGSLTSPGSDDGRPGTFSDPGGIWCSPEGPLYVADTGNATIRKLDGGVVTTIAGEPAHGALGIHPEFPSRYTPLSAPSAITADAQGDLVFLNAAELTAQSPGLIRIARDGTISAYRSSAFEPPWLLRDWSRLALPPMGFSTSSAAASSTQGCCSSISRPVKSCRSRCPWVRRGGLEISCTMGRARST
jgi:hypothetical protein